MYFITGGMPEAVRSWTEERDTGLVQAALRNILNAYELGLIWNSIPSQLARENKKFLYSAVKDGARGQKYEAETKIRLRFSLRNLKQNGTLLNIPLFMIDNVDKLIELGMEK